MEELIGVDLELDASEAKGEIEQITRDLQAVEKVAKKIGSTIGKALMPFSKSQRQGTVLRLCFLRDGLLWQWRFLCLGVTEGMETSAALGEEMEIHGALVIPLPGCCGWRFSGGAVLSLAREGKTAQAGEKQSAGKKYLQWKGGEGIMKKKECG